MDGCVAPVKARDWCLVHYRRWQRTGTTQLSGRIRPRGITTVCEIDGCERPHASRGWCGTHYERWRKHGDPTIGRPSVEERFWSKVDKTDDCWNWTAGLAAGGYGAFGAGAGRSSKAHRFAYELLVGPIPDGLQLDHLCRNRRCVNPAHLEPVTQAENIRRGEGNHYGEKTHCKWGHPFDEANTIRHPRGRTCRACLNRRKRDYRARLRERSVAG